MSRVTKADDMHLTQPFSPALFQQGPQPWPTLLRDVLRGAVAECEILEEADAAEACSKKPKLLKYLVWTCHTCVNGNEGNYKNFLQVALSGEEWED